MPSKKRYKRVKACTVCDGMGETYLGGGEYYRCPACLGKFSTKKGRALLARMKAQL